LPVVGAGVLAVADEPAGVVADGVAGAALGAAVVSVDGVFSWPPQAPTSAAPRPTTMKRCRMMLSPSRAVQRRARTTRRGGTASGSARIVPTDITGPEISSRRTTNGRPAADQRSPLDHRAGPRGDRDRTL